jgi:TRAP-type mannitol/chloroaromatic compound transport system permease small subunit
LAVSEPELSLAESSAPTDSYGCRLPWGLDSLTRAMNALGTVWILGLMVLINADVIGRNLFGAPVSGVPEMISLSIVGIVFLQLADTLHAGRFTRADLLLERLRRQRPALADAFHAFFHAVGAALMLVILWASWEPLVYSVRILEYVGAIGNFQAPVWPIKLITLVGLGVTALCYALLSAADLRRLRSRHAAR